MHEQEFLPSTSLVPSAAVLPLSTGLAKKPDHYEAVRTATSMLCKEMLQHRMDLKKRELEVVRVRMRALRRLELVWGQDDSEASLGAPRNRTDLVASILGGDRVHRLFARALQDGYILCQ
jgi:hypothetical protein